MHRFLGCLGIIREGWTLSVRRHSQVAGCRAGGHAQGTRPLGIRAFVSVWEPPKRNGWFPLASFSNNPKRTPTKDTPKPGEGLFLSDLVGSMLAGDYLTPRFPSKQIARTPPPHRAPQIRKPASRLPAAGHWAPPSVGSWPLGRPPNRQLRPPGHAAGWGSGGDFGDRFVAGSRERKRLDGW